tara:strand:+ start:50 stop:583 length:534 start_codon:yes stop_codon:yes gene_type:complete
MASELRVDKIIPTSGVATNGSGGLVQTRFSQVRLASASTTSQTFIDSGVQCSITPKFTTSKIIISVSHYYWFQSASESDYCVATIYRDSTNLGIGDLGNNATSGTGSSSQNSLQWYAAMNPIASYNIGFSFEFLDQTHNSTSELTYKLYLRCNTSGSQLWYAWPGQVSTMRLQELSA